MSTEFTSSPQQPASKSSPLIGRFWPALAIIGLGASVIGYLQIVGVVDNGTSNGFSLIAALVTLILLSLWTALLAPFPRATRLRILLSVTVVIVFALALVRIDGFDGNLKMHLTWRWRPKPDVALAALPLENSVREIDLHPTSHDFAGFLGSHRDAYVPDVHLAADWKQHPPKLLWRHPIGGGYSAFAIVGQAAFTLEQRGEEELVTCYDVQTGALVWHHGIKARHYNEIGGDGPGSTPTVVDGRVYAMGGTGVLRCLDAATGKPIWIRDVLADVGTNYETDRGGVWWGRMASPLLVGNLVVVPGGGPPAGPRVSLIAYDKATGEIVWKGGNRQVSYSSPSLATYVGVRQIVIVNEATITGHDLATGAVLWETKWEGSSNSSASASQTVQIDDEHFFVSKGYSMGGGALFEIKHDEANNGAEAHWSVKKLWHNHRVLMTKLDNVVVKDGAVYGLSDGVLQCVDLKTGRKLWEGDDYGHGQLLRVDDGLLITGEWGAVALVELNPKEFHELARFQAIEGKTWNNPALSGNLLLVRNAQEAACYELPIATGDR